MWFFQIIILVAALVASAVPIEERVEPNTTGSSPSAVSFETAQRDSVQPKNRIQEREKK